MSTEFDREHDRLGVEFDWLATDRSGRFGYFSTAGFGPIPRAVSANPKDCDVYEAIVALDAICESVVHVDRKGSIEDWVEVAKRGFYAYDWTSSDSAYELIASPTKRPAWPLPDQIAQMLDLVVLPIEFGSRRFSP